MTTRYSLLLSVALISIAACNLDPVATFDEGGVNPLSFTAIDVHGRQVRVGVPSDYTMILFFNGEETSDAMQPITQEIAIAFADADDLEFVNVVDLRTLAFYEHPFANGSMRGAQERTIRRINTRLQAEGLDRIENLFEHMFLINDSQGLITTRFQVPDPNQLITAIIYRRDGTEIDRFDPQTELDAVIAAIESSRNE